MMRKSVDSRLAIIFAATAVLALVSLFCGGCGGGGAAKVTDSLGRQVQLPPKVERVACLYPFAGQTVAMLGMSDKIVAVPDGLKRDILLTTMYPHIKDAAVPMAGGKINMEELLKVKPDVVFIGGDAGQDGSEIAKLKASGIPYIVVDYRNIKEQQAVIELVGKVVGAAGKAAAYNAYYQELHPAGSGSARPNAAGKTDKSLSFDHGAHPHRHG